jgi:hypothetical protein
MRLILILLGVMLPELNVQSEILGRLFFSREQRIQIDNQQTHRTAGGTARSTTPLRVNGIVQHHGGPRTVWINGTAQLSSRSAETAVENITVKGKSNPLKIKVGQVIMLDVALPQSAPGPLE